MSRKDSPHSAAHGDLAARLAAALRTGGAPGITIIDQPLTGSRRRHLTIVWDAWESVALDERSRVILDAYEQAHPDEPWRVLEITLAVGLTAREAQKLKIA